MNSGLDADNVRPAALTLGSRTTTAIGSFKNYISQPNTDLGKAKNGEITLMPNYQYKRRFQ